MTYFRSNAKLNVQDDKLPSLLTLPLISEFRLMSCDTNHVYSALACLLRFVCGNEGFLSLLEKNPGRCAAAADRSQAITG
jgi:hypothetical protein